MKENLEYLVSIKSFDTSGFKFASKQQYLDALTEMWEAWITNPATDDIDHLKRGEMLLFYKNMYRLIESLTVK